MLTFFAGYLSWDSKEEGCQQHRPQKSVLVEQTGQLLLVPPDQQQQHKEREQKRRGTRPFFSQQEQTLRPARPPLQIPPIAPNQLADKFQDLVKFKDAHGHCHVPHNWAGNSSLAHWVNNQRYQYKLRISTSSESRVSIPTSQANEKRPSSD
jgi:hypothetical protein